MITLSIPWLNILIQIMIKINIFVLLAEEELRKAAHIVIALLTGWDMMYLGKEAILGTTLMIC